MTMQLHPQRADSWVGQAVFALDRWLRRRQGSVEFSRRPDCLFRIEPCIADRSIRLGDGTRVLAGDAMIRLHFWNEHVPRMGRRGPTVGWARQLNHAIDSSLRELAWYLTCRPDLGAARALCGDMNLATRRQTRQFQRIIARYGFETAARSEQPRRGALRRIGETILVLLLVLATNPIDLRHALRSYQSRIYLSRTALQRRYGDPRERRRRDASL